MWAQALAGLGLGAHDGAAPQRVEYLWPDNLPAWHAWQRVGTQWRTGVAGPTGLDYAGVRACLDELDIEGGPAARREIFAAIQAAEIATLEVWAERREREQATAAAPRPPAAPQAF